jgi:type III restriction enzyme
VVDSTWEHYTAQLLEKRADVAAYAKNDHLGFQLQYLWRGSRRKFVPDFLIRLSNGKHLALEIKGKMLTRIVASTWRSTLGCERSMHAVASVLGVGTWSTWSRLRWTMSLAITRKQ